MRKRPVSIGNTNRECTGRCVRHRKSEAGDNAFYVNLSPVFAGGRGALRDNFRAGGGFKPQIGGVEAHDGHMGSDWFFTKVQNESAAEVMLETARAKGGARDGSPRHSRILFVTSGKVLGTIFPANMATRNPRNPELAAEGLNRSTLTFDSTFFE